MSDAFRVSRRAVIGGAAALPFAAHSALAADTMVVATWGGDYASLLRGNVDEPILGPLQIAVTQDVGDEDPRVAKMYASRRLPRGADDVVCLQAVRGHEVG